MANNEDDVQPRQPNELVQIVNRLLRKPSNSDRLGSTQIFEGLEVSPIPLDAVVPIANSMAKSSILDYRRKKMGIPLMYVWLDVYLCANKGAKKYPFIMLKDLAAEQLAGDVKEAELGEEGD